MARPEERADLFDVMYSCRAMRRLKPDPVPEDVLVKLVDAAIQGPSSRDLQGWKFVIVRERGTLRAIQTIWRKGLAFYRATIGSTGARPDEDPAAWERSMRAGQYMVDHLPEAPAVIFACMRQDPTVSAAMRSPSTWLAAVSHLGVLGTARLLLGGVRAGAQATDASLFPAVQNLLLAARALGLGAVLTTPHLFTPGEFERLLNLPADVTLGAVIPVGYPKGKFGSVSRPPARDVLSWDTYRR